MFSHPRIRRLLGLFLSSLMLCFCLSRLVTAQSANPAQLVQQGVERYQAGAYQTAVDLWQNALNVYQNTPANAANIALVRENLARAQQQLGKSDTAIELWEQVTAYYRQANDLQALGRSLTEQAQIYSSLGQARKAIALLCGQEANRLKTIDQLACLPESALQLARAVKDTTGEAAALGSLGEAARLRGDYQSAIVLLKSIALDQTKPAYRVAVLNSLGNAFSSRAQVSYRRAESAGQRDDKPEVKRLTDLGLEDDATALKYFWGSLQVARKQPNVAGEVRSLISAIPAYYRTSANTDAMQAHQQATALLTRLPDSRDRVYAAIDLAQLLQPLAIGELRSRNDCLPSGLLAQAVSLLQPAVVIAQQLRDHRAESFALGALGHLEQCRGNTTQALHLTKLARLAADQDLKAKDSLYLWEWQTGRILKALKRDSEATAAYQRAIDTLETIRSDILSANRDLQFDFRETIEPIYRELIALRLEQEQPIQNKAVQTKAIQTETEELKREENFKGILGAINSLKLAELQNYFGNDCVIVAANPNSSDSARDPSAAIINTIILEDQTAIILSLPDGQKKYALYPIKRERLVDEINAFRQGLESYQDVLEDYNSKSAQQVYNWLVRPFADDLKQAQIKTLVFVQDGILRSVPMAALHDGEQFLIQKYAIATTPSLSATDTKPFKRDGLRVLALGLTQAADIDNQSFPALKYVSEEILAVEAKIPGSKSLEDTKFTRAAMEKELSQTVYPIIHLATHGQFGTDPEETFIVTGDKQKLTLNELDRLIRQTTLNREPLELITLTACKTAVGDDRSSLGLAGVAIQAGARSAIASLWSINDEITAQIATDFYTRLPDKRLNKAQALQLAQKTLLEKALNEKSRFAHPAHWAPFVLVGNWQ